MVKGVELKVNITFKSLDGSRIFHNLIITAKRFSFKDMFRQKLLSSLVNVQSVGS